MRDLEFIRGSRGSRQNDVAARCSEPPFPTRGGQDDGSYTNSLKLSALGTFRVQGDTGVFTAINMFKMGAIPPSPAPWGVLRPASTHFENVVRAKTLLLHTVIIRTRNFGGPGRCLDLFPDLCIYDIICLRWLFCCVLLTTSGLLCAEHNVGNQTNALLKYVEWQVMDFVDCLWQVLDYCARNTTSEI